MVKFVNLPEDIMEDILTRLSATSLGRFRCVSKQWRARLSNPLFVKTHLARSNHRKRVLVHSYRGYLYSLNFDSNNVVGIAKKLSFQAGSSPYVQGSCNGLVLIADYVKMSRLFLFNPTTQQSSELPISIFENPHRLTYDVYYGVYYGLGYDSGTDDYKVVELIYDRKFECNGSKSSNILVHIYTTKSGCWRRLQNLSCHYFDYEWDEEYGIFVNGFLHWLAGCKTIIAFDLVEEKFREMPLPSGCVLPHGGRLVVLDGCIGMKCWSSEENVDAVWVMKEYGTVGSWTKFPVVSPGNDYAGVLICSLRDGEILFNDNRMQFFWYNVQERRSREVMLCGLPNGEICNYSNFHRPLGTFVESLVSPESCNGNGTDDYKVVKLIHDRKIERDGSQSSKILVDVYETKSRCWRRLKNLNCHYFAWVSSGCVLPNGYQLVVLDGCIGMKCWSSEENVDAVWVMKEYGAAGSWTQFHILSPRNKYGGAWMRVLCSLRDGEILLNDYMTSMQAVLQQKAAALEGTKRETLLAILPSLDNLLADFICSVLAQQVGTLQDSSSPFK
ncbi:hypothetical protein RJ640_014831 [Escallonia rubra]|uniref:F-box domain-containing protein n=1 Tax=Escallonia rubra TaxID=112253 RepID=A0AA88RKR8_9ASTE|nr:hypothetical protein RJ640_014831 [Escallonia rubra]